MSTRCHIATYETQYADLLKPEEPDHLKDFTALLYQHSDGYPGGPFAEKGHKKDGVLPAIIPLLRNFKQVTGSNEPEYSGAQLLAYLIRQRQNWLLEKRAEESYWRDQLNFYIGYGICNIFHYDIEYFYAIFSDGVIQVWKTGNGRFKGGMDHDVKGW